MISATSSLDPQRKEVEPLVSNIPRRATRPVCTSTLARRGQIQTEVTILKPHSPLCNQKNMKTLKLFHPSFPSLGSPPCFGIDATLLFQAPHLSCKDIAAAPLHLQSSRHVAVTRCHDPRPPWPPIFRFAV